MSEEVRNEPRWRAVVTYLTGREWTEVSVTHDIEELEELQDLIERGPDWNAIKDIVIVLNRTTGRLTVEEAARL